MSGNKDRDSTIDSWSNWGLIILASVVCLGAIIRVLAPNEDIQKRLDEKTLLYLSIAGGLLLLKDVKNVALGDYKIEFQEKLKATEKKIEATEENIEGNKVKIVENERILKVTKMVSKAAYDYAKYLGKNAGESNAVVKEPNTDQFDEIKYGSVEDDPWKGQFGGKDSNGNCKLTAEVIPDIDSSGWFYITLRVESTDRAHQLKGKRVKFYVHDTFPNSKPVVRVENGIAELNLRAWGAFTVGAITDKEDGNIALELDLAELKDPALAEFVSR